MNDRILLILKTQNLSSSQFADEIGVQRSSISHILSGRNNPSLEFVTKILKRFPDINSEWILFRKGSMYRESDKTIKNSKKSIKSNMQADLFSIVDSDDDDENEINAIDTDMSSDDSKYENLNDEKNIDIASLAAVNVLNESEKTIEKTDMNKVTENKNIENSNTDNVKPKKAIEKIVIFYSDKTFREYFPE